MVTRPGHVKSLRIRRVMIYKNESLFILILINNYAIVSLTKNKIIQVKKKNLYRNRLFFISFQTFSNKKSLKHYKIWLFTIIIDSKAGSIFYDFSQKFEEFSYLHGESPGTKVEQIFKRRT